jgi:hypothetical protein
MMVIGEAIMMVTEAVSGAVTAEIIDKQDEFKAALRQASWSRSPDRKVLLNGFGK